MWPAIVVHMRQQLPFGKNQVLVEPLVTGSVVVVPECAVAQGAQFVVISDNSDSVVIDFLCKYTTINGKMQISCDKITTYFSSPMVMLAYTLFI